MNKDKKIANTNISIVTKEDEDNYPIPNYSVLIKYYKLYEEDFSDHILTNIVIETLFLIRNMSFTIKFYEYYL